MSALETQRTRCLRALSLLASDAPVDSRRAGILGAALIAVSRCDDPDGLSSTADRWEAVAKDHRRRPRP